MNLKIAFVCILEICFIFLRVHGKGCKMGCKKHYEAKIHCVEPNNLTDMEWAYAIGRQANSIIFRNEFESYYNNTKSLVIHGENIESIVIGNVNNKCLNDGKGRKRNPNKRGKGGLKRLPEPLPKDTLVESSLCEWVTVDNVDPDRKPVNLIENKCGCRYTKYLGKKYLCENLEMHVAVLRRTGCLDGIWRYTRTWEPYSVACVPVRLPSPQKVQMGRILKASV